MRRILSLAVWVSATAVMAALADAPTKPAPVQLSLSFYNDKGRQMGQPPAMTYGRGFMIVSVAWTPTFTEKEAPDVYYKVWVRSQSGDWGSATRPGEWTRAARRVGGSTPTWAGFARGPPPVRR